MPIRDIIIALHIRPYSPLTCAAPCVSRLTFHVPCRGRGQVVAVAAGSDCVTVVTSRAFLLRYDYNHGSSPGGQPSWATHLSKFSNSGHVHGSKCTRRGLLIGL